MEMRDWSRDINLERKRSTIEAKLIAFQDEGTRVVSSSWVCFMQATSKQ